MKNVQVRNTYGETNGMTAALDQNSTTAATSMAWTNSGVALSSNTNSYLASETAGNSDKLTQLAIVETSDTISPDCLNAVGSYRAGACGIYISKFQSSRPTSLTAAALPIARFNS